MFKEIKDKVIKIISAEHRKQKRSTNLEKKKLILGKTTQIKNSEERLSIKGKERADKLKNRLENLFIVQS